MELGIEELNLVDVPSLAATRQPAGLLALGKSDPYRAGRVAVHNPVTGKLPGPSDTDVLLALMKLCFDRTKFSRPDFCFSYREILRVLSWQPNGRGYQLVRDAVFRWSQTVLAFDDFHWKGKIEPYIFSVFRLSTPPSQTQKPSEELFWDQRIFDNVKAGYTKSLKWNFYLALKTPLAKRLYRVVDKAFRENPTWQVDLFELAGALGENPTHCSWRFRQKLSAASIELEQKGFLHPISATIRFRRMGRISYQVTFIQNHKTYRLTETLRERGISKEAATRFVHDFDRNVILRQISAYDQRDRAGDLKGVRNRGALLRRMIEKNRVVFPMTVKHTRNGVHSNRACKTKEPPDSELDKRKAAVDAHIEELVPSEANELERTAVTAAPPFWRDVYDGTKARKGPAFRVVRYAILWRHLFENAANAKPLPLPDRAVDTVCELVVSQ